MICCFISFDINLLVATRNFASANFRNSEFSFVQLKYRATFRSKYRLAEKLFALNFTKFHEKFRSNILENKEGNSPNYVYISFAQYCITYRFYFSTEDKSKAFLDSN